MIGIILEYSNYYNKSIPENPLGLLTHLPKNEIIVTIAKINTLLQPHIKNIENITPINEIKNEKSFRKEFDNLTESTQRLIETLI